MLFEKLLLRYLELELQVFSRCKQTSKKQPARKEVHAVNQKVVKGGCRMKNLLRVATLVAAIALMGSQPAIAQTCLLGASGSKEYCGGPRPGAWQVSPCDETGPFLSRMIAWCIVAGGTWTTTSDCVGDTPFTDENVVARSVDFANRVRQSSCSVINDTGYGAEYFSTHCLGGGDQYQFGELSRTARRLTIECENDTGFITNETISIDKRRPFNCPVGSTPIFVTTFGTVCARPLEDCDGCGVGNPITPLTGIKVASETDYSHAQGLAFTRYYHSIGFFEPHTTANGTHTENRLGLSWRSTFDKRVIPIVPSHATLKFGMSLPSGEVQFFNASGAEVYNYRGGAGTLVPVSGVGYYYLGPDATEFFGTDGRLRTVTMRSGLAYSLTYSDGTSASPNGGVFVDAAGNPTTFVLPADRLIRVTDSYGNSLAFAYDLTGRIVLVHTPGGGQYRYTYDLNDNLQSVESPDGRVRTYRYNEPTRMVTSGSLPNALTSVVDENGDEFAVFKYDPATNRAVSTERAGGTLKYEVAYSAGSSSVIDPLGAVRLLGAASVSGITRFTGASQAGGAGYGSGVKQRTYDASGNVTSITDFNDHKTCHAYLALRNLESARVEGLDASASCSAVLAPGAALPAGARKIETEWHSRWRAPLRISEPLRRTTYQYNGDGAVLCAPGTATIEEGGASPRPVNVPCTKTVEPTGDNDGSQGFAAATVGAPRTWSYTYSGTGQILTMDGPRTDAADVTSYTYDAHGRLSTVVNAAGHITSISAYNAHGQPLTIVDPNGLTTTLAYDARQRLTSRTVGTETTSYEYDGVGQLTKITLPDGSFLTYSYDAAHRLTGMQDNLGNRIAYTLDAMGNRTQEQVFDPGNSLAQTRSRVFNNLNRLFQEIGAASQVTEYAYDNQGNVTSVKDPLNKVTANAYDALNRLRQVTDPGLGVTQYAYNGLDALTGVTDPRNLTTSYTVDGLGNHTLQQSPDTGNTANTYDAAGNLLTQTDAKGQVTSYAYDALNRVTLITFHDGSKQAYAYDQGTNGQGRLTSITETDPGDNVTSLIAYAYDAHGRVTSETRTLAGQNYVTAYSYDGFGRMDGITYPSGRTVTYAFDALGRVSAVSTTKPGGSPEVVVQNVTYYPFGGVTGFTFGNGQSYTRNVDQDGRIASYTLGGSAFQLAFDAASRISGITEVGNPSNANTYGYDALDRLTSAVLPSSSFGYSYDAVGNRLTKTVGASTDIYAYDSASNRIASVTPASGPVRGFTFDPNGSTIADGLNTYAYDARGRMVQAVSSLGSTDYQVNALGQRVRKTNTTGDIVFHYDTRGRLIAETDPGGTLKREFLYLGDIPVGVVQ